MNNRRVKTLAFESAVCFSVAITLFVVVGIIAVVFLKGRSYLTVELIRNIPSYLKNTVGILPNILNTLYVVFITLIIALPLGIGTAVFLNEYSCAGKFVRSIEFAVDILAGVPSVIYGLVGLLLFVSQLKMGTSLVAGALTLTFLVLPGIVRTTEESLKSVPTGFREGAFALGAGRWHTTKTVVLPSAVNGIVAGAILAVGRITGESAALLFTAGAANKLMSIFEAFAPESSGATLTVALYIYAKERGDFDTAFAIALVLLLLTLMFNLAAKIVAVFGKGNKGL